MHQPDGALFRAATVRERSTKLWQLFKALLGELSDESAYRRHLAWHNTQHSPEEWRRFCEHRLAAKYKNGKCC